MKDFLCDQCGNVLWRLMVCVKMFKDLKKISAMFMFWRNEGVSENEICFEEIVTHVLIHFGERKMCVNMVNQFHSIIEYLH